VLYIGDDAHGRAEFVRIAKRWPMVKLLVARSGREGLAVAAERRLRIVVLDARLPDVRADELVVALRRRAMTPSAPIVVVAGADAARQRARFLWAGADAYLPMPLTPPDFDHTVGMLLEAAALR